MFQIDSDFAGRTVNQGETQGKSAISLRLSCIHILIHCRSTCQTLQSWVLVVGGIVSIVKGIIDTTVTLWQCSYAWLRVVRLFCLTVIPDARCRARSCVAPQPMKPTAEAHQMWQPVGDGPFASRQQFSFTTKKRLFLLRASFVLIYIHVG